MFSNVQIALWSENYVSKIQQSIFDCGRLVFMWFIQVLLFVVKTGYELSVVLSCKDILKGCMLFAFD